MKVLNFLGAAVIVAVAIALFMGIGALVIQSSTVAWGFILCAVCFGAGIGSLAMVNAHRSRQ